MSVGREQQPELEIIRIDPARRRDRRRFVELPFTLAAAYESWQPGVRRLQEELIDPGRNPFWQNRSGALFIAMRGDRVVGRLAVIDPGTVPDRPEAAVLAFPDFVDERAVSTELFAAAEAHARRQGAAEIIGPLNPDIHHDVGIQIDGHERRNAILMGFQPPYYAAHFDAAGYERLADFEAWCVYRDTFVADGRLRRLARRVERQPSLRIRPVDRRRFDQELEIVYGLYAGAFADHWCFTAPSRDEFRFIAADLRYLLRDGMALVAEWNGTPAGFVLGVPDLYAVLPKGTSGRITPRFLIELLWKWRQVDEVRVMIAGVLPPYRRYGLHLALFYRIALAIFELGFRGGEISWVMADNHALGKALPLLGARRTKTYRVYSKKLHQ